MRLPKMRVENRPRFALQNGDWPKRTWLQRWASRIVARMLLEREMSYECTGRFNWAQTVDNIASIQASNIDLAHWVLFEAGYGVRPCDLKSGPPLKPSHF